MVMMIAVVAKESSPPPEYSDPMARIMVQYASVAYCTTQAVQAWKLNPACSQIQNVFSLHSVFYANSTDAFAYVGSDSTNKIIVVAFKGTDPSNLLDWIDDLEGAYDYNIICHLNANTSYHGNEGFCNYYKSLVALGLVTSLNNLIAQYPSYQLWITGHSLGGAAAAIHAADLIAKVSSKTRQQINLVTYGEPRVGDYSFVQLLKSGYSYVTQINRVVHLRDIVPHLPPCCFIGQPNFNCSIGAYCPYNHPREVWYNNTMTPGCSFDECSTVVGEDPSCSDSEIDVSISDHLTYFGLDVGGGCCQPRG